MKGAGLGLGGLGNKHAAGRGLCIGYAVYDLVIFSEHRQIRSLYLGGRYASVAHA